MKSRFDFLKKWKPVYWVYNLLHYKKLLHNRKAYQQFGIGKPLFASISSKDFPDKKSSAWLDLGDSVQLAPQHPSFNRFSLEVQEGIKSWSEKGYILLRNFVDDATITAINDAVEDIVKKELIKTTHDNKIPFANKISAPIRNLTYEPKLISILNFILGKEVVPFQTLNFIKGSNQRAHSDSIHMTTYPLGYLIAAWVALEDTNENNGPLFYYPGSHKLPYLLNNDFNEMSNSLQLGRKDYSAYEEVIEEVIQKRGLKRETFFARKGDVFIWHANLLHGGSSTLDASLTRKSMVIHYYAKDVIKYHEITERPSLMDA